jgi:hypothetical protein
MAFISWDGEGQKFKGLRKEDQRRKDSRIWHAGTIFQRYDGGTCWQWAGKFRDPEWQGKPNM